MSVFAQLRKTIVIMVAGASAIGYGEPLPTPNALAERMRQGSQFLSSFSGTETITKSYIGIKPPDLSSYVVAGDVQEGQYRWYVQNHNWWMIKEIPIPSSAGKWSGTNRYVYRNLGDKVLNHIDFLRDNGEHHFLSAHLDEKSDVAQIGPMAGRLYGYGSTADIVQGMTNVHLTQSVAGYEIEGTYRKAPFQLTVAPQYGYLTTRLLLHPNKGRFGFQVTKVKQLGQSWMPESVELFNGHYEEGQLTQGFTGHVQFSDFTPHSAPTATEVPQVPAGSMFGSEEGRLYRLSQDGTLIDAGRMGERPNTPLAWGDMFVLSGAGLLLVSLSWLVFRTRRSSPPSPSPR